MIVTVTLWKVTQQLSRTMIKLGSSLYDLDRDFDRDSDRDRDRDHDSDRDSDRDRDRDSDRDRDREVVLIPKSL